MKIIREPKVYLVGYQKFSESGWIMFCKEELGLDKLPETFNREDADQEQLCEMAGRLCYMSFGKGRKTTKEYLANIIESQHGSVTEHAVFNFVITGVSRSLTHELVRHRAGFSYSQLSQRYVDESIAEYIEPDIIANDPVAHKLWEDGINQVHLCYVFLADRLFKAIADTEAGKKGIEDRTTYTPEQVFSREELTNIRKQARQAARSVLPNATETKIFVTMNARAARHFIELRATRHADVEIRKLAIKILEILQVESPNLFGDYTVTPLPDGTFEATTDNRKI